VKQYPNAKSDIFDFISYLSEHPGEGEAVPGYSGKIIKIRWPLKSYNIGKSGGLRIYYYFYGDKLIPFFIFTKRQFADARKELIAKLVSYIEEYLAPSED
jgi:hypothetical protein